MPDNQPDILSDAVARNAAAVLSLPSAGMLRHHKTRLLASCAEGIWIESPANEQELIEALIPLRQPVGISFKGAQLKTTFAVPILQRDAAYKLNATSVIDALLVQKPAKLNSIQRRNDYRVRIPEGSVLAVRTWRIADHAQVRDRPLASQEIKVGLRDLSVGGLGVFLRLKSEDCARLAENQRLRVELKYEDTELILDAVLRHKPSAATATEGVRIGIQFKKLENDLVGRQALAALTRIVGELQREEVRRSRLGLAEAS